MARPSRAALASAKLAAVIAWASVTTMISAAVTLGLGALLGLTAGTPWPRLGRAMVGRRAHGLCACLCPSP